MHNYAIHSGMVTSVTTCCAVAYLEKMMLVLTHFTIQELKV